MYNEDAKPRKRRKFVNSHDHHKNQDRERRNQTRNQQQSANTSQSANTKVDVEKVIKVTRPDQIHDWLEYKPDQAISEVYEGIGTFITFLQNLSLPNDSSVPDSEIKPANENALKFTDKIAELDVLRRYVQHQKSSFPDENHFHHLFETWTWAVENSDARISELTLNALAEFFRAIGDRIEFLDDGVGVSVIEMLICKENEGLWSQISTKRQGVEGRRGRDKRNEEYDRSANTEDAQTEATVIASLNLIVEMLRFDAGARALEVWLWMKRVAKGLEGFLDHKVQPMREDAADRTTGSAGQSERQAAVQVILALLTYLDVDAKLEMLAYGKMMHLCLAGLIDDSANLVLNVLKTVRIHLVQDVDVPRQIILRFFNLTHLQAILGLFSWQDTDGNAAHVEEIRKSASGLLIVLCTSSQGVLVKQYGFYPLSVVTAADRPIDPDYIDLGLDSPYRADEDKDPVAVNQILSQFCQKLKIADPLQSSLLRLIFQAVPELVADYFSKKRVIPVPDSDDQAWRDQIAFLFSVISSPVPEKLGWKDATQPPPLHTVVENVVPRCLDRTYLSKLMGSEDMILKISGARLLVMILEKLGRMREVFSRMGQSDFIWQQARQRLIQMVEARLPVVRDITIALQHTSRTDGTAYTSLLEALSAYHSRLPSTISTFDIGSTLSELCTILKGANDSTDISNDLAQLELAVRIAQASKTKWLHKSSNDALSPVMQLLAATLSLKVENTPRILYECVFDVLTGEGLITKSQMTFSALFTSLRGVTNEEVYQYLDLALSAASRKPVHFLDMIEAVQQDVSDRKPVSLFTAALVEQWPYALKKYDYKEDKKKVKKLTRWLAGLFSCLDLAGENYRVLNRLMENMKEACADQKKMKKALEEAVSEAKQNPPVISDVVVTKGISKAADRDRVSDNGEPASSTDPLTRITTPQMPIPDSLQGLEKWPEEIDIALEVRTGRFHKLFMCTAHLSQEVRLQTFHILQHIQFNMSISTPQSTAAAKPPSSTDGPSDGNESYRLLLGELLLTHQKHGLTSPLPSIIPELAHSVFTILVEPMHHLFPKINRFLLHAPVWEPRKVLTYWIDKILLKEADSLTGDPAVWRAEVAWLMDVFTAGLRTYQDFELYWRASVWERIGAVYSSPVLAEKHKISIDGEGNDVGGRDIRIKILTIVHAAVRIPGAGEVLWMRCGMYSWLEIVKVIDRENGEVIKGLIELLERSVDRDVLEEWKVGSKAREEMRKLRLSEHGK